MIPLSDAGDRPAGGALHAHGRQGESLDVLGLLGIAQSPSCGVATTNEGGPCPGRGVFMGMLLELRPELAGRAIDVPHRYGQERQATARFHAELRRLLGLPPARPDRPPAAP